MLVDRFLRFFTIDFTEIELSVNQLKSPNLEIWKSFGIGDFSLVL